VIEKAKGDKNTLQKIRLIVNVITPDTLDKKFEELRVFMFGERKLPNEEGFDPEADKLTEGSLSDENMNIIVETIFRKAQNEKEYCTFYGDLCEKIIRLEINFLGHVKVTVKNIKGSQFRKSLLNFCRTSFDQFFTLETKELLEGKDDEKILKFKHRLFGNIMFVGELNRRGLLQESIILSVFDMLLGVESKDEQMTFINDQTVEGATVLMTKIGELIDSKLTMIEEAMHKQDKSLKK
jgi:MIF4G domain